MKTPVNAIALLAMATTLPFNALAQNPSVEERLDALEAQSPGSGVPGATCLMAIKTPELET